MPNVILRKLVELVKKRGNLALRIAKDVAPLLPDRNDGPIQSAAKIAAAFEAAREAIDGGKGDPLEAYASANGLVEEDSEPFVSLFFDSTMSAGWKRRTFELGRYEHAMEATSPQGVLLFAIRTSDRKPNPKFWRSPSLASSEAVADVWAAARGRLTASVTSLEWGDTKTRYGTFPEPRGELRGRGLGRLDALVASHRRFQVDGLPRSYGFFGEPGTGKTLTASLFAARIGTRALKVDAGSFARVKARDFGLVLSVLEPDFVIVDDVDKASASVVEFLGMMERFGADHPGTTLVLTANSVAGLDRGLLRPERVSEWIRFEPPDADDRRALLRAFLAGSKCAPSDLAIEGIVERSEGLTQDYLRELALVAERTTTAEVWERAERMKALLAEDGPSPDDAPSSGTKPIAK